MNSANSYKWLDLDTGLPTRQDDIIALRRVRTARLLSFAAYLDFLGRFAPQPAGVLRARRGPTGPKPFVL